MTVLVRMARSVLVCGDWGFPGVEAGSALCFRHPARSLLVGGMPVRVPRGTWMIPVSIRDMPCEHSPKPALTSRQWGLS